MAVMRWTSLKAEFFCSLNRTGAFVFASLTRPSSGCDAGLNAPLTHHRNICIIYKSYQSPFHICPIWLACMRSAVCAHHHVGTEESDGTKCFVSPPPLLTCPLITRTSPPELQLSHHITDDRLMQVLIREGGGGESFLMPLPPIFPFALRFKLRFNRDEGRKTVPTASIELNASATDRSTPQRVLIKSRWVFVMTKL